MQMTTENPDICGLVVSPHPRFSLGLLALRSLLSNDSLSIQVCVVPYVLHERASGRVYCTEEVPQVGSDCRVGM